MKKKIIITSVTVLGLLILSGIIFSIWLFMNLKGHIGNNDNLINYWNTFWTCVAAFAVPVSILGFWFESQNQQNKSKQERQEAENKHQQDLIDRDVPHFISAYEQYMFVNTHQLESTDAEINEKHQEALEEGKYLLHQFHRIYRIGVDPNDPLKNYNDDNAYFVDSVVIRMQDERKHLVDGDQISILVLDAFNNASESAEETQLNDRLETGDNPDINDASADNDININPEQILLVRKVVTSPYDFDGSWRINWNRAEKIKYVVGVQGYVNTSKKYLGIIDVKNIEQVEDRVKFIGPKLNSDSPEYKSIGMMLQKSLGSDSDDTKTLIENLVEQWKGINPTVYVSHLVERYLESHDGKQ